MNLFSKVWSDDAGVVTIEYLVLGTFLALALIVGVTTLAKAINVELVELANTILTFNQAYSSSGLSTCVASKSGSAATDTTASFAVTCVAPVPTAVDVAECCQ